jgi:2-polyprenyl-3-methyl-5-hydroxy-6-metoxy-1,4-benzoquinol methylase
MANQIGHQRFLHEGNDSYVVKPENIDTYWDNDYDLKDPDGWEQRYLHEANLLLSIAQNSGPIKNILDIGSGPGRLGDLVLEKNPELTYDMVDGDSAKKAFLRREYKGRHFYTQNLFDSFDVSEIKDKYDMIVMNDFLEHIRNPSLILQKCRENLCSEKGFVFVSVPNWRMEHHFFYPGLFDYDNFMKFMIFEGFNPIEQYQSWSSHVPIRVPKLLNIETKLNDDSVYDWNWYILFTKTR